MKPRGKSRCLSRLLLVSVLAIFLELSVIRWLSAEIHLFSYLNQIILLVCFIGLGAGCYRAAQPILDFRTALAALFLLLILVELPLPVSIYGKTFHLIKDPPVFLSAWTDFLVWHHYPLPLGLAQTLLGIAVTFTLLALLLVVFIPLGQEIGKGLNQSDNPALGYSVNLLGSLLGCWLLQLFSLFFTPPWVWFAAAVLLALPFLPRSRTTPLFLGVFALFLCWMATRHPQGVKTLWSPYQKLEVQKLSDEAGYSLTVNKMWYMELLDVDRLVSANPQEPVLRKPGFSGYDIPYWLKPSASSVLVIGAGGGNDLAVALRHGVKRVTAVEIDPGVVRFARALHPNAPYADSRVTVAVDDGRAFLRRNSSRYDVVCFGLVDAHTLGSVYSNIGLDYYLYTREAFRDARRHLAPGGLLSVSFVPQEPWMAGRIRGLLSDAFGHDPLVIQARGHASRGWYSTLFLISDDTEAVAGQIQANPYLQRLVHQGSLLRFPPAILTSDDWPFLYLQRRRIPFVHLILSGILLVLLLILRFVLMRNLSRINWHFALLGAAFFLFQCVTLSKTALLLGGTWVSTAATVSSTLALALLANLFAPIRVKPTFLYPCLIGSVALIGLGLPFALSLFPLPGGLTHLLINVPVLFSGSIFIRSLQKTAHPEAAFGWNLLGAGAGGLLQLLAFIGTLPVLYLCVAVLYFGAFLCRPQDA